MSDAYIQPGDKELSRSFFGYNTAKSINSQLQPKLNGEFLEHDLLDVRHKLDGICHFTPNLYFIVTESSNINSLQISSAGRQWPFSACQSSLAKRPLRHDGRRDIKTEASQRRGGRQEIQAPRYPLNSRRYQHEEAAALKWRSSKSGPSSSRPVKRRLFVASMVDERKNMTVHAFAAQMASSEQEFRTNLEFKIGYRTARTATVMAGFDPSEPIAASLLSDSIADILLDVRNDPTSILAAGLDVFVEHRFA